MKYFNINKIRLDFPILKKRINKKRLTYLDNAATTQKPKIVINAIKKLYKNNYASIHRGVYTLSNNITNKIEEIRIKITQFIKASYPEEIIFTKGATESINLIANTWGRKYISKKDNIIISITEHHANIIPWFIISKEIGFQIKIFHIKNNGKLNIKHLMSLINKKTKIICITHISNVLGIINPLHKIIKSIKIFYKNIKFLIDGSQAIAHQKINVQKINCDFYVFSSHKIYAPTGTGIIYNKNNMLQNLLPWQGGGGIIANINLNNKKNSIHDIKFINSPWKFETGTNNIESIIGLNEAINYINNIGIKNIIKYERKIIIYTLNKLKSISYIKILGKSKNISNIISFNIKNHHHYDIGLLLDQYGIAIRTGHQCSIPIMKFYNISGVCRISIALYTSKKDINFFIKSLNKILGKVINNKNKYKLSHEN